VYAAGLDGVFLESDDHGATFTGSQREDRLPLTAISVNSVGKLVKFSKQGPEELPMERPSGPWSDGGGPGPAPAPECPGVVFLHGGGDQDRGGHDSLLDGQQLKELMGNGIV